MKLTERMGERIRDNISLIVGICMPLIVLLVGGTAGLVLRMQYQLGQVSGIPDKMAERKIDVDNELERVWRTDRDQYEKIGDNASTLKAMGQRLDRIERRQ